MIHAGSELSIPETIFLPLTSCECTRWGGKTAFWATGPASPSRTEDMWPAGDNPREPE